MPFSTSATRAGARGSSPSPSCPRLIAAAPAVSLLERWRAELAILQRRSPTSDAAATLADCVRELVDAINAADDITVQLTVADAHAISRIPLSTLRWLCKHKPSTVGARKYEGVWYLDRTRFHAYLDRDEASSPRELPVPTRTIADTPVTNPIERLADLRVVAR